jgi:hypothetical protein
LRELEQRLAERDSSRAALEGAIAERDRRIAELLSAPPPEATADLDALEKQLVQRGQELRQLEAALAESERLARELIFELKTKPPEEPVPASAALELKLAALADRLATSEADRLALSWAVAAAVPS